MLREGYVLLVSLLLLDVKSSASAEINWRIYHNTDKILQTCQKLATDHPQMASLEEVPDPESQFRLPVLTITDSSIKDEDKQVILLVAGEHARELITSEIVYWLSALLLDNFIWERAQPWPQMLAVEKTAIDKGWASGTNLRDWGRALLQKVVFKVVPVLNIAGRKAVEAGDLCLRKTISGVDLNRNWPYAWEKSEASTDEYSGEKPFSEPEARIIKFLAQAFNPHVFVNLHSGEWAMYVPWDSKKERAPDLPEDTETLLEEMNVFCQCMNGPAGTVAGYLAMGTSMDWMYAEHHVRYPLTLEVFGPKSLGRYSAGGHPRRQRLLQVNDAVTTDSEFRGGSVAQQSLSLQNVSIANSSEALSDLATNTTMSTTESPSSYCVPLFNPTTVEEYREVVSSWIGSLLALTRHLAEQPVQAIATFHAEQLQQPELKADNIKEDTAVEAELRERKKSEALHNEPLIENSIEQADPGGQIKIAEQDQVIEQSEPGSEVQEKQGSQEASQAEKKAEMNAAAKPLRTEQVQPGNQVQVVGQVQAIDKLHGESQVQAGIQGQAGLEREARELDPDLGRKGDLGATSQSLSKATALNSLKPRNGRNSGIIGYELVLQGSKIFLGLITVFAVLIFAVDRTHKMRRHRALRSQKQDS